MQRVTLPGGVVVDFPDGMTPDMMSAAISKIPKPEPVLPTSGGSSGHGMYNAIPEPDPITAALGVLESRKVDPIEWVDTKLPKEDRLAAAIAGELPKLEAYEGRDPFRYALERMPFVGGAFKAATAAQLRTAHERYAAGVPTGDDLKVLAGSYIEGQRAKKNDGFGQQVADVVSALPGFGVEIAATGGAGGAARAGLARIGTKVLGTGKAASVATKLASGVADVATRTALLPTNVAASAEQRRLGGKDVGQAYLEGFLDTFIEVGTEQLGEAIPQVEALDKIKKFVARKWTEKTGRTMGDLSQRLKQVGYNGVIQEMLEERAGEVARGATVDPGQFGATGDLAQGNVSEALRQLSVEAVAFSVVPGAQVAAEMAVGDPVQQSQSGLGQPVLNPNGTVKRRLGQPVLNQPPPPLTLGPEPQIADKANPLDRPNPGPAPPQDVSVPSPAAEEESDVAQDPREEVIPDDLPEETVQGRPQGQVAMPVSGPPLPPETGVPNQAPVPEQLIEPDVRAELDAMTPQEVEQIWRQEFPDAATAPSKSEMIEQLAGLPVPEATPSKSMRSAMAEAEDSFRQAYPEAYETAPETVPNVAQDELPPDVAPAQPGSPVAQPETEPVPVPVVAPEAVQEPVAAPKKKLGKQKATPAPEPVATPEPTTEPLYESLGDDGTKAQVFAVDGGYSVSVYDPDSGERLPTARIYKDLDRAKAYADTIEVPDRPTIGKKQVKQAKPKVEPAPEPKQAWETTRDEAKAQGWGDNWSAVIRRNIESGKQVPDNVRAELAAYDAERATGSRPAAERVKPVEVGDTVVRYTHKDGKGLLNNEGLDRSKLTDDEEAELVELMDLGLQQPPGGTTGTFYFTADGEKQHERLLELLAKASKSGVVRTESKLASAPTWQSTDGQVAAPAAPPKQRRIGKRAEPKVESVAETKAEAAPEPVAAPKQEAIADEIDEKSTSRPGFIRDLGVVKPKNVTDRGLPKHLGSYLATAKATGIATDGRMAFKLFGKDKTAVDNAKETSDRALSPAAMDAAMAMNKKKSYSPATVVGARPASTEKDSSDTYLLESESGSRLTVDAKLLQIIRTRYPKATMVIADKTPYKDKVYFRQDGEVVAVLMPFNEKSPVLESESAEDDADQDEPKQGDLAMMGTPVHVGVNRTDAKTGGEIRAADIVTTWSRLFNVPIKIGGFRTAAGKGKRKLGIYRHLEEIVLLAEPNAYDIVVASHEIAHHIDKKLDATGKMLSNLKATNKPLWRTVRSQLKALDYNPRAGRVFEGFAELSRHLLTGDRSVAPEAMTWFRSTVLASDPKLSAAMDKAMEHADKYAGMGFMERAKSIFGGPARDLEWKEVKKRELLRSVDKLYQDFVDRHWFVKKVSDKIQERGGFSQDATMYELLMVFDGTANAHAAMALMEGITTVSKTRRKISGSLAEILDPITSEEEYLDAQAYAVAKHTLEVPGEYNTSMSVDDAQAVVDWVKSDPDRFAKFDGFAAGLTTYNNALLEFLYDAGRISKEDLDRMLSAHGQTYVPLLREVEDDRRRVGSGGLVTMPKAVPSRSKRGSGRPVRDLIESTILRTQRFYRQAMNQQVIEALVRNADPRLGGVEGMGEFISRLDPGMKNFTGTLEEVLDDLVKEGWVSAEDAKASKLASKFKSGFGLSATDLTFLANRYGLPPTADEADVAPYLNNELDVDLQLAFWRPDYRLPNGDYAIRHVVDGETVMYRLDKDFYEAIGGMDPTSSGVFFEVLRRVQAPFKVGAVGLSTGFAVQNIVRDALTATVNSQETSGAKRITKPFEWAGRYIAAVTNAKPSEIVDLFREYGGELYSAIGSDRDDLRRFRQKIMKVGVLARIKGSKSVRGGMKEVADVTKSYIDHVRQLVAWSDVGPRLAEVEGRLKRAGYEERGGKLHNIATGRPEVPPRDVIVKAMNAGGDVTYNYRRSGRVVKQHVEPFLPFTNALVQSVDKSARVLKSMLGDIGSKGLSGKRARQAAVALAVMTTADIVFTMLTKGDDDEEQDAWLKYGYFTSGTGPDTNKRLGKSREYSFLPNLISAALNGGTPELYEAMSHEAVNRMPNGGGILWSMAEVARNWSSFRDRPLEPPYMMDDPVAMRTTKYILETSNIAGKVASKFPMLNELSPIEIEHLMNGASGGAYRRWVGFGERALATIGLKQGDKLKKEDIPFYRGFIVDRLQDVSVDEFYDQKDKVLQDSNFSKGGGDVTGFRDNRLKYERFLQYETLMKIMREGKSDDYNPQVNIVALSRDALGKQALASYPHPLYHQELPEAVRTEILKTVVREVRQVAEALDRPTEPGDKLDKWIIAEEAAQAFIKEHAESPFVKEAIEQVRTSESVRNLIRGRGRPRTIGKRGEGDFTNRVNQFDAKREAALQFLEAVPQ